MLTVDDEIRAKRHASMIVIRRQISQTVAHLGIRVYGN
jgi:hypothetical protein